MSITYDNSGNPLSYYNGTSWNFTWTSGRQLASATGGGNTAYYYYNQTGSRNCKTVNGVTHHYTWLDNTLIRELYDGAILDFSYDANGQPYAMYYNSTPYFYILNLQGDVIRMVDGVGNIVASYEYDPYGKVISATGWLAEVNPLRYRGYYYDTETQLYYLWSRYYDPQTGRFINADAYASTGQGALGYNMFAYCNNNPINFGDAFGNQPMRKNTVFINDGAGGDIGPVGIISSHDWCSLNSYNNAPSKAMDYILNDDESVVLEAEHLAFYKGVPVVKVSFMGTNAFSCGVIFMGNDVKYRSDAENTVRHEYGHSVHFNQIGVKNYLFTVAIPSLVGYWGDVPTEYYYSQPWEYIADYLGGVKRTYNGSAYPYSISSAGGLAYWSITALLP